MRACPHCKTPYASAIEFCGIDGARLVESDKDPLVGAVIDRYRVVERLGGGGMAAVYRAVHTVIDRQCALKVLFGELASDKLFAERFRREAQAASKIKHANVVEVLDFGTTPEGASFLLMELLEGRTLADLIAAGPVAPAQAALILRQVGAGLAAAHAVGFIHRDLKPANIMLVEDRAKILDFGLAQPRVSQASEGGALTRTGQTLGTPYYMSPEQIDGGHVTERSDLYSLGVILHEMLAGQRPFTGSLSDILLKHATEPPPPLAPAGGLELLAAKLLEKAPAARPASAVDVVRTIESLGLLPTGEAPLVLPQAPPEASADAPPTRSERTDRAPRLDSLPKPPSSSLASALSSSSSLTPSGAISSIPESVRAAASAPTEAHTRAPSASSPTAHERPQVLSPSVSSAPVASGPMSRASPASIGIVVAVLVGLALVLAAASGGFDAVRVWMPSVKGAAEDVGDKALKATIEAPPVEAKPPPVDTGALAAKLDDDIAAALKRRGFTRADEANIASLASLQAKFDAARSSHDVDALRSASSALVAAIAGATLSAAAVEARVARLARALEGHDGHGKHHGDLKHRLKDLEKRARSQRSEAERGRIMLDAAALENEL